MIKLVCCSKKSWKESKNSKRKKKYRTYRIARSLSRWSWTMPTVLTRWRNIKTV